LKDVPRRGGKETATLEKCVTASRPVFTLNRHENVCLMN
jgi:hypothetical protein